MRLLLASVLALIAGCASSSPAAETTGTASQELVDAGPALPECDGTNFRHVCGGYPATRNSQYGVRPSCGADGGTPFLPTDADGGVAFRADGQSGCVNVGAAIFDGPAVARCCP